MSVKELDKKFLARSTSGEVQIVRSRGSQLMDADGKRYIDFQMGWCVGNLGWGNEVIEEAIRNFHGPDYVQPDFLYKPWSKLANILAEITPGQLSKTFRATGGTEAIEAALQIAMIYTGRYKFMSLEGSYHGDSLGALSIGTSESRKKYKNLLRGCLKIDPPLDVNAVQKVEARLKRKDIAAFIMEPIVCNLGVLIPDMQFMHELQGICKKYGTLLVMDEVATGFGRTGKLFASEHFGIEPDILCMAKALSGGYAPIGATITTGKIAKKVQEDVDVNPTYGWHPICVQAALANLDYLLDHEKELLGNANRMGEIFYQRLIRMKFRHTHQVRAVGLAIAIDAGDARYVKKIVDRCQEKGLIISPQKERILLFPALTIDEDLAHAGLDILEDSL